ncbi:hypothetical protein E2K80_00365 [Rhodophyticola sp. CCM32]|uniref:hypothetical protein n=1 Tax=Rhodophyticola sp. CCM32 TaxID=2916397 RepID=UPI00107F900A|nr:hypothetical protein [Rhodophyticola sp. CCM32]QBX99371.1 hypothetical protein E2K80_00365 [Rhodophyticola sp. CCM32]
MFRSAMTGAIWTGVVAGAQSVFMMVYLGASGGLLSAVFGFLLADGISFLVWLPGVSLAVMLASILLPKEILERYGFWPLWIGVWAFVGAFALMFLSQWEIGSLMYALLSPAHLMEGAVVGSFPWHTVLAAGLCGVIGVWVGATLRMHIPREAPADHEPQTLSDRAA